MRINRLKRKGFVALVISVAMLVMSLQTTFAGQSQDKTILLATGKTKTDDSKNKIPFLKSNKSSAPKTYAEENEFEYVSADKPLVQKGFITLKDDSGKWITMKQVKPKSSEISIELDKITSSKPDKEGFIEVTIPYSRKWHREVVSSDAAVTWVALGYYDIPAFVDAYTGNMLGIYLWWDYRPDED